MFLTLLVNLVYIWTSLSGPVSGDPLWGENFKLQLHCLASTEPVLRTSALNLITPLIFSPLDTASLLLKVCVLVESPALCEWFCW